MKDNTAHSLIRTAYVIVVVILSIGYIKGVVRLCECDFKPSYKAEVIYGVGTITGLNFIFGWMDFGK
jgi:hypothetical protein